MSRLTASMRRKAPACRTAGQRQSPGQALQLAVRQPQPERQTAVLGAQGRRGHALDRPAKAQDEHQGKRDVERVGDDQQRHRTAGVLQSEQPAQEHQVGEAGRRAQQANADVAGELGADARRRLEQQDGKPDDQRARRDQQQSDRRAEQQRADKTGAQLIGVRAAECLRGQPGGAHAQESEYEVEHVEGQRAERYRPEVMGLGQMPDHGGVDDAEQRHREVGEDQRPSQPPGLTIDAGGHPLRSPNSGGRVATPGWTV